MYRLTVLENPYLRTQSLSPKQFTFLTLPCREMLFGGAAGGGKSRSLLLGALQYVMVPGYSALLLRRTFSDLWLPKALIQQSHEILAGTDARWDGQKYRWHFPSGAVVAFGYLASELDKYRYQGSEFQFVGFDEVTQFQLSQYTYLSSRMRRLRGAPVPLRLRGATNPGGVGGQWVYERFIDPRMPREGRVFIPSKLEDNPWLDKESYEVSLNALDRVTRAQLRHGDWEIRPEGNCFKADDFRHYESDGEFYQLTRDSGQTWSVAAAACLRFATLDVAATEKTTSDWSVMGIWDQTPSYDLILRDLRRWKLQTPQVVDHALNFSRANDCEFVGVEANGVGLPVCQSLRQRGLPVKALIAKNDKLLRSQAAQLRVEAHTVHLPKRAAWLAEFLDEVCQFPQEGLHDDQVDVLSWAAIIAQQHGGATRKSPDVQHLAEKENKLAELADVRPGKSIDPEAVSDLQQAVSDSSGTVAADLDVAAWLAGEDV